MFPTDIDFEQALDELEYMKDKIEKSAHGIVPKFDYKKGEFIIDNGKVLMNKGDDAVLGWIDKILRTTLWRYEIYYIENETIREYGVDLKKYYFGKKVPKLLLMGEMQRDIEEALLQHKRIKRIESFRLDTEDFRLFISFNVILEDSEETLSIKKEVRIPDEEEVYGEFRRDKRDTI